MHPDFALMFDSTVGAQIPADDLLTRVKKARDPWSLIERMHIQSLHMGTRDINGFPGQQSLTRYHELTHTTGYGFVWDSQAVKDQVFRPALYLEMQTGASARAGGKPVDSSIPEDELLLLWERISSSIRIRPTETPKASAPPQIAPTIGAHASAGDPCPQTGWWQCSDDGYGMAVRGGRQQYFKEGERMPQAVLLVPQTILDRIRRRQLTHQSQFPTVWRLVELPRPPDLA